METLRILQDLANHFDAQATLNNYILRIQKVQANKWQLQSKIQSNNKKLPVQPFGNSLENFQTVQLQKRDFWTNKFLFQDGHERIRGQQQGTIDQ